LGYCAGPALLPSVALKAEVLERFMTQPHMCGLPPNLSLNPDPPRRRCALRAVRRRAS
jgi:hypothetical protein